MIQAGLGRELRGGRFCFAGQGVDVECALLVQPECRECYDGEHECDRQQQETLLVNGDIPLFRLGTFLFFAFNFVNINNINPIGSADIVKIFLGESLIK